MELVDYINVSHLPIVILTPLCIKFTNILMSFSLKISRLEEYNGQRQQAGLWNRILWLESDGDVLFVNAGVAFNRDAYAGAGWLLEFDAAFYHDFITRYQEDYNSRLFTGRKASPTFLPITDKLRKEINDLASLLKQAADQSRSTLYLQSYTDLILLNLNRCYVSLPAGFISQGY